jgi:very-short-patch-repair endonuclease
MNRRGYDVIRFGVQEIDRNLQGVVDTIYQAVQARLMARGSGGGLTVE